MLQETSSKASTPHYKAPALEKGIDVIELLGTEPFGLTITEIAQRLDRSISELFRVVVVLDRRGWLEKDTASDRYRVTYRLLEAAYRATPAQELTHVATAPMHALAGRAMQSCHLVVMNGTRALVVARQESPGPTGFAVRLGTQVDLLTSCSGHVLLAFLSPERRADLFSRRDLAPLQDRLETIRAQGFERLPSARMTAVADLSCPVFGFEGRPVAALTIPFLEPIDDQPHLSIEKTLDALRETTAAISHALGWFGKAQPPVVPSLSVAEPPARRARSRG